MKKLLTIAFLLCSILQAVADTWTDNNGVVWNYSIENGNAVQVKPNDKSSITGDLVIPEYLDSYPVISIADEAFSECNNLTSVKFPNSVKYIGKYSFKMCENLATITLSNSLINIEDEAFWGCKKLESLNLPGNLEEIGEQAFCGCEKLTTLTIPGSVETIESEAFIGCSNIDNLTISEGVKSIGYGAFAGFKITSVNIPKSVTQINYTYGNPFYYCRSLETITVDADNPNYYSQNNSLIERSTYTLVAASINTVIPNGIKIIGTGAFYGLPIETIAIPNTITTIGNSAFSNCEELVSITIPSSVTKIDDYAFSSCPKIESIQLSSGLKTIGSGAFWTNSNSLTSIIILEGVTTIGTQAFRDCYALEFVSLPSSLNSSLYSAFLGCTNLSWVEVNSISPMSVDQYSFPNRSNATLSVPVGSKTAYLAADYWKDFKKILERPSTAGTEANPFTCADANAFAAGLTADTPTETEWYVKGKVCSIEENFNFKNGMATFWISDDGTQNGKFYIYRTNYYKGAHGGRIPNLGDEVILYGKLVNYQGTTPETVSGESRLISINDKTTNRPIETNDLFDSLTDGDVDMYFVAGCPARPGSSTGSTNIGCSVGYAVNGMQTGLPAAIDADYNGNVTIPETVEGLEVRTIAPYAFANTKLKGVIIPSNVWDIEVYAFSGCTELAAVSLPENIILNRGTFKDCTSLTDIKLPKGVILYGGSNDDPIFSGCTSLTAIRVFDETPYALENKLVDDPSKVTLYVPAGSKAAYETADYWKDFGEIYEIFSAPIQLNDGTVDAQFRIIDENAKTVETFGTFRLGPAIEKATEGSITIPAEVNGYQVVGIGSWSFRDCENITHVSLPATITTIGASAFRTCYQLQEVNIPEGVTSIGLYAFKSCIFSSLTLPSSLQTIEEVAFEGCNELTSVTMSGSTPPTIGEYTFNINNPSNVTIYVPLGSLVAYQTADYWNMFNKILELEAEPVSPSFAESTIIPWGTEQAWEMKYVYFDEIGNEPGTDGAGHAWTDAEFDDTSWATLAGPGQRKIAATICDAPSTLMK